jgi:hypothetical protein
MKVQFSDNAFMAGPRAVGAEPAPAGKDFATVLAKASTDKPADAVKKTADTVKKTGDHVDAKAKAHATPAKPKPEKIEDVPGHAYDEIVAGPRNGMFINDSGNARDGKAFVLVERDGRTFHIYGSGKDRQVFEVDREPEPKPAAAKKTTSQTGATVSGA